MRPKRLSYSSVSTYERCPAAWEFQYVQRIPRTVSPAANRGTQLHSQVEKYFKGEIDQLSVELWRVRDRLAALRQFELEAEKIFYVDGNWQRVDNEQSAVWMAILDIVYATRPDREDICVIDLKSGKNYPEHKDQLALYAAITLSCLPYARTAHVSALYLDLGEVGHEMTYTRDDLPALREKWNSHRLAIAADFQLAPTPSVFACRYCDYSEKRGGPCSNYWREEKRA